MSKIEIIAPAEMWGLRLDKALALIPEVETRSRAAWLIDEGKVFVNKKPAKASAPIKQHDHIEIELPEATSNELLPYDFKLDILFEDKDIVVINKPAGLVVHPAAGHEQDTLVNALLAHTQDFNMKFGDKRPGIVHRIDKETSGILVVAKNDQAHENLVQQFKERSTDRVYYAVCIGRPRTLTGTIQSFLARHPIDRKRYASLTDSSRYIITDPNYENAAGKWAITHFEVLKYKSNLSYLKLKLETGRTHQIRIHMSEAGAPIAGDVLYGADKKARVIEARETQAEVKALNRFLLHAAQLSFTHPTSNERMSFESEWPAADLKLIQKWGLR